MMSARDAWENLTGENFDDYISSGPGLTPGPQLLIRSLLELLSLYRVKLEDGGRSVILLSGETDMVN